MDKNITQEKVNKVIKKLSDNKYERENQMTIDSFIEILKDEGLLEELARTSLDELDKDGGKNIQGSKQRKSLNVLLKIGIITTHLCFAFLGYQIAAFLAFNFPNTAASFPQGLAINVNPQIVTDIKVQTSELKKELEDEKEESQEKDENINKLQEELTALENQLKVERENISKKDEDINKLQQEITRLQEELTALKNQPQQIPSIPEETTRANSSQARANLKPDKERYTDLENIFVNFSFENIDYAEGYIIQLVPSNRPVNYNYAPRKEVGKNDNSTQFTPRTSGNYEIRAYINTGTQWKLIERKPIEVTAVPEFKVE